MMAPYCVFQGARKNGALWPSEMACTIESNSELELRGECCMSITSQSKPARLSISAIRGLPEPRKAPHKGASPRSIRSRINVNCAPSLRV